ncbi:MAG: RNA polymerase sigma factor [Bacteroidales bacterium]|nr:RNA polymerase sigma factor [Bacteroidales bacterium]
MTAIEFNHQIISYQSRLKRFAYSLVSDRDEALDLVQETYLKAISYREKLSDYSNLKVWTMTIMKNIFINNYRRKSKGRDIISEKIAIAKDLDAGFESTESYYTQNEINKSVDTLNEELKAPFIMYVDGFKYREIADELNLNIGTVKSRIHTARQRLMESLKDFK